MNQDVGFAAVAMNRTLSGAVVWLTTTRASTRPIGHRALAARGRRDRAIPGRLDGAGHDRRLQAGAHRRGGNIPRRTDDVAPRARWGQRDDPFRVHTNGDVMWAWFDAAAATTLHVARVRSGTPGQCPRP